ncbi:hypothetical protein acsn021_02420 [Anaerocolumna cellulosilytica]|uniref:Uncharacterized protein n=1 Tax=Anaerocolumna cellulosilytica TaxID=433286 RepID=A0A6S6QMV8_9FIRM|nr:hypothetical protein [Anaerocolumna cellulosilytica]MBB5196927.1 hypothetical protein [Anaerocolumna cellulosilytica]BCJ92673.1 hypothetical protein acsn021_02420 [Anaerocolumna cellulosilytica]
MSNLYDVIVNELNNKSISALIFLLDSGRELSFKYNNIEYAITWNEKKICLENENHDSVQKFDDAWSFIENVLVQGKTFLEVWSNIELLYLF